jgi:hypothetical protein
MLPAQQFVEPSLGDPIAIEDITDLQNAIKRNRVIPGEGLEYEDSDTGLKLNVANRPSIVHATSPGGGIGVATSDSQMTGVLCDVRVSSPDGSIVNVSYQLMIYNKDTVNPVGNSKKIIATWDGSCYVCTWEQC